MRKFINSQVKSKDELRTERARSREQKAERRATRDAEKAELERQQNGYGDEGQYGMSRYQSGQTMLPASGADFDSAPHHRHFSDRRIANPAPLGLFAFAFSAFLLGLVNLGTQGVTQTTALVSPFLMYSGVMMSIAAIFELVAGNTFGATAFGTFAGFYLSLGGFFLTSFGTYTIFGSTPNLLLKFVGLFFATWMIPFGIFVILTIRSTWTLWLQFVCVFISLAVSCAQYLKNNDRTLQIVAGAFLLAAAAFGYLNGAAGLMQKETVFFQPPVLQMPWSSQAMVAGVKGPDHPDNNRFPAPMARQYTGQSQAPRAFVSSSPPAEVNNQTYTTNQTYAAEYVQPEPVMRTTVPRTETSGTTVAPPLGPEGAAYKLE